MATLSEILSIMLTIGRLVLVFLGFVITWPIALWRAKRGFKRGLKRSQAPEHIQKLGVRFYEAQLDNYRFVNLFKTIFLLSKEGHI